MRLKRSILCKTGDRQRTGVTKIRVMPAVDRVYTGIERA